MSTPDERLREARINAGYDTAKSAAEAMGVPVATYIQHENGGRGMPPARVARYGRFFRVAPEWILYGRGSAEPVAVDPEITGLPVLGSIQAGAWLAIDDSNQDEPEIRPAARDRRYPHADQWLREVQGDSMNARNIFPGDFVHIVDLTGAGVNLNTGMIVEVVRTRAGGLREITLKEVEVTADGLVLWPRSTNPRWSEPVRLDHEDGGDIEVQVTGLLLAKITLF
jgi:SOS-response transcriptional repressor LexA